MIHYSWEKNFIKLEKAEKLTTKKGAQYNFLMESFPINEEQSKLFSKVVLSYFRDVTKNDKDFWYALIVIMKSENRTLLDILKSSLSILRCNATDENYSKFCWREKGYFTNSSSKDPEYFAVFEVSGSLNKSVSWVLEEV